MAGSGAAGLQINLLLRPAVATHTSVMHEEGRMGAAPAQACVW